MFFKKRFILNNFSRIGEKTNIIGNGGYSVVYNTTKNYVIKSVRNNDNIDETFILEASILKYIKHPCIIKISNIIHDPIQLVFPKGIDNLRAILIRETPRLETRRYYFYCLFSALEYLHKNFFVHRDIKPDNIILIKDNFGYRPVLCDFGLSTMYFFPYKNSLNVVTEWWKAPELYLNNKNYTEAIDIWAMGKILLECIYNKLIKIDSIHDIYKLLDNPTLDIVKEQDEKYIIEKCLTWQKDRFTATQLLEEPYFKDCKYDISFITRYKEASVCTELMIKDWNNNKYKIKFNKLYKPIRFRYINYIFSKCNKFDYNLKTAIYIILLFDIYMSNKGNSKSKINSLLTNYQLLLHALIYIGIAVKGKYSIDIQDLITRNVEEKELKDMIYNLLCFFDYNLIIPTCYDFLIHSKKNIEKSKIKQIILDYDLVEKYTPYELSILIDN
jgi:serine/threonine protein kinase